MLDQTAEFDDAGFMVYMRDEFAKDEPIELRMKDGQVFLR